MPQNQRKDFDTVYDQYADMLYRVALSYLNCKEDAQDAVHDVFIKYLKCGETMEEEHQRAWLVRLTINQCHDISRKKKYRIYTPLDEIVNLPSEEDAPEIDVCRLVSSLPEKYRAAVTLHYLEGYKVEETASMLKISVSAVKMRLSRSRTWLKKHMGKEEEDVSGKRESRI